MCALRIAPARQLVLFDAGAGPGAGYWDGLPDQSRAEVLALLARIIARGVLAGDGRAAAGAAGQEAAGA
jgi:hypothetical protein